MADSDATDLTAIDNIGPSTADNLREAGIETPGDVVDATDDELMDVLGSTPGFNEDTLQEVRDSAVDVAIEDVEEDLEDLEGEDVPVNELPMDDGPEFHEVTFNTSGVVGFHVVNNVVQEALRMRRRNEFENEETLYGVALQLMEDLVDVEPCALDVGDMEFSFRVTQKDLDYVHQAVSAGASNYRAQSGLPSIWGDLSGIVTQLNQARDDVRE